jgi:hypothetical protein
MKMHGKHSIKYVKLAVVRERYGCGVFINVI